MSIITEGLGSPNLVTEGLGAVGTGIITGSSNRGGWKVRMKGSIPYIVWLWLTQQLEEEKNKDKNGI